MTWAGRCSIPQRRQAVDQMSAAPPVRHSKCDGPRADLAAGDFDNDGAIDILINNNGAAPLLLHNRAARRE